MRSVVRRFLDFCGRNGPLVLLGGVALGLALPAAATAARPYLGLAVFLFTLGAFLKVDLGSFRREIAAAPNLARLMLWSAFGVPLTGFGIVTLLAPPAEIGQGMILALLAPPAGSTVAVAAIVGLGPALALLVVVVPTALSPLYLPVLAEGLTGHALAIDTGAMALALVAIVGGALGAAALLRRVAGRFVAENPDAMVGVTVLGLAIVAVGCMDGVRGLAVAAPELVAGALAASFAVNLGFQALGAVLFVEQGPLRALTLGLVSGNRNVTLIWAALGGSLAAHPATELYLAMSLVWIFLMPALIKWPVRRLLRIWREPGAAVGGLRPG